MAFVGMKYCMVARITGELPGQPVVYGEGVIAGKAMNAEVSYTRNADPLYADDGVSESDNSITGGTITFGIDDISNEARKVIMNETEIAGADSAPNEYEENGDASPDIGLGYMRVRRLKGVTSYVCYLIHKTQLAVASESASTKGSSITWQTPSLTGPIMAVQNTADMKNNFRRRVEFANEADGLAWLKSMLNVPSEVAA